MIRPASLILSMIVVPSIPAQMPGEEKPSSGQINKWIAELASSEYQVRQSAFDRLAGCGPEAVESLRQAIKSKDPEVRLRAGNILARVERRIEAGKLLTPTRINLDYQDAPLPEVVKDLAKRTGLPLILDSDLEAELTRKITLRVKDTPVLEALALFYTRANLSPPWVKARAEGNFEYRRNSSSVIITTRRGDPDPTDLLNRLPYTSNLVLRQPPADAPEPVVSHAGAIQLGLSGRIRPNAEEVRLEVEAMTEPHLEWEKSHGVRIDRAIDEKGRPLTQVVEDVQKKSEQQFSRRGVVIINRQVIGETETSAEQKNQLMILKPHREAKRIREMQGVLIGQVQTPLEDLVAVDQIMALKKRHFPGRWAGSVLVKAVDKATDGSVRLLLDVTEPPRELEDPRNIGREVTIIVDGKVVNGPRVPTMGRDNFHLEDEAGRPWELASASHTGNTDGRTCEIELVFSPRAKSGPPMRFIYRDRRSRIIEIPFTFKDIALPESPPIPEP